MLILANAVSPVYKAREKKETARMEAVLKTAIDNFSGESFSTTIFTRPANPMRSKASWFLSLAYRIGAGITDDSGEISIAFNDVENLSEIADCVWSTKLDPEFHLFAASDGSVVVGMHHSEEDTLQLLPFPLQLRGTLKTEDGTSIKQVYRTGDRWPKPQGIFLTPKGEETTNVLSDTPASTSLCDLWEVQIGLEMKALLNYHAKYPLRIREEERVEEQEISIGLGMFHHISTQEMTLFSRKSIHDCHLHLGFRSFNDEDQEFLAEALRLAVEGWLPEGCVSAFSGHDVTLLAGCPYDGSEPRLELNWGGLEACLYNGTKEDRDKLIAPVKEVMRQVLDSLNPSAMIHHSGDVKASWTIAEVGVSACSAHDKVAAQRAFRELIIERNAGLAPRYAA
jgi:hypothetical protein